MANIEISVRIKPTRYLGW